MEKAKQTITLKEANVVLKKIGESCTMLERIENDTGVINPLYLVKTNKGNEYILKLTNKRYIYYKTLNEATVLDFVKKHTKIPVPGVFLFDCIGKEIGYEYILMEKMQGDNLSKIYKKITKKKKEVYLDELANYVSQLRKFSFKKIGSFQKNMRIGPHADISQGPFKTYAEYMAAVLDARIPLIQKNHRFKKYVSGMKKYRDRYITTYREPVKILLTHADLDLKNILVHNGHISAILDWEWSIAGPEDEEFYSLYWIAGKDKPYFNARLKKYGVTYPEGFKKRFTIFKVAFIAIALDKYKEWFVGKQKKAEKFIKEQERTITRILKKHNCS
ncbi:hypothetical protein C4573_00470 [Candidatus Woesearchaeota archaeon]|nr:MAG: hypothetical protein C4573_00470 [Candidatus Woesearchaeota archaeon]